MTSIFKSPTQITQRANGLQVAQSLYGQTIPYIFGNVKTSHKLVWASNFQAHAAQQGKKGSKKGGGATQYNYTVNADLLISYGPIEGVGTVWQNQVVFICWYDKQISTGGGLATTFNFTVTPPGGNTLVMVMGVAVHANYSQAYTDYVYPGETRSFTLAGTTLIPLYNNHYPAPNSGTWQYAAQPYAVYNTSPGSATVQVVFPAPVASPVVTIYYEYYNNDFRMLQKLSNSQQQGKGGKKSGGAPPLVGTGLVFEQVLGSGSSGNPGSYPDFSGSGGANIALGPTPEFPHLNFEVKGLFGLGNPSPASNFNPNTESYTPSVASGDCNPADIIADIICSGNRSPTWGNTWNHGLGFSSLGISDPNHYSRFGGILKDEPNIWGLGFGGGSNLGLNLVRNYCGSYGIFISGVQDAQLSGAQFLDDLCKIANCAPCYDGVGLDFITYCEVSNYGNGYNYLAQTSAGPIFDLVDANVTLNSGTGPIATSFQRTKNNYNSYTIEFRDKSLQFNSNSVLISDSMDITTQGQMPGSLNLPPFITDAQTAQAVGWSQLRRSLIGGRYTYRFELTRYWESILTLMDFVTIIDTTVSQDKIPVRITKISCEKDKISCEAELYSYGANVPNAPNGTATTGGGGGNGGGGDPGSINTPIIFEAVPGITKVPQLWMCTSGSSQNYGGCSVWMSTDGGATYGSGPIGTILGRQKQGLVYSATYPNSTDPDNTNTLHVDLTESLGILDSFSSTDQNAFLPLCYTEPGGTIVGANNIIYTIPYELVSIGTTTLAAANKYSCVPPIRRGALHTPTASHAIGTKFSYLNDDLVFKWNLPQNLIGVTLFFKFTSFNIFGQFQQALADATAYSFTPTGQVGFNQQLYTISPSPSVYQGQAGGWAGIDTNSSTWTNTSAVYFPPITAQFNDGTKLDYAARDAGLSGGAGFSAGGVTVWVTIYDPTLQGETGTATLNAFVDQNQTKWNTPGYIRIGTLVSVAGGGGGGDSGGTGGPAAASDNYIYIPPIAGTYITNQELYYSKPVRSITLPQNLVGSHAGCRIAPTGAVQVVLKKNGVSFGTVNIAGGATTATFTVTALTAFNGLTDDFTVVAPASPDSTFAGFWLDIQVLRLN